MFGVFPWENKGKKKFLCSLIYRGSCWMHFFLESQDAYLAIKSNQIPVYFCPLSSNLTVLLPVDFLSNGSGWLKLGIFGFVKFVKQTLTVNC